jgi:hypothetical protein
MSILPTETYSDLIQDLYSKFPELQKGKVLEVRFKDEDGDMLNMEDEGDFEAAIDVARQVFHFSAFSLFFSSSPIYLLPFATFLSSCYTSWRGQRVS